MTRITCLKFQFNTYHAAPPESDLAHAEVPLVEEVEVDGNEIYTLFGPGGTVSFLGQVYISPKETVVFCENASAAGSPRHTYEFPNPVGKIAVKDTVVLVRMDADCNPATLTKAEWERFCAEGT